MKRQLTFLLVILGLAAASGLRAQMTLYVSFGASINAYDANTGAFLGQPATGLSNPWQMTLDGAGNLYASLYTGDNVAVVNPAGGTVNPVLLTPGVSYPTGIAVQGNLLYLASQQTQKIAVYNATTGALINASFISGVYNPEYIVLDGNNRLYVSNNGSAVSVYDATTGAVIDQNLVTGLVSPMGMAVDDQGRLYVATVNGNKIGVYDSITGAVINSDLIAGLVSPRAVALDPQGNLYVSSFNTSTGTYFVGKYDPNTGAVLNPMLLGSGASISSLNFKAVPEPATWMCLGLGLAMIWACARRRLA